MNIEEQRKAFEDEFRKINSNIVFWLNTWDEEMQGYNHPTMCWIWHMWCKSANREGYKFVPLEATEEMVDAVYGSTLASDDLGGIYKAMIGACDEP